jgi:hypothetical protein
MSGWAYVFAAFVTALAVCGVGALTNKTSMDVVRESSHASMEVARTSTDASRQEARREREFQARKQSYFAVMAWLLASRSSLLMWNQVLRRGASKPPDIPVPEPLDSETNAQLWTVGSTGVIKLVQTATSTTDSAIASISQSTWIMPPEEYDDIKAAVEAALGAVSQVIGAIRLEMTAQDEFKDADVLLSTNGEWARLYTGSMSSST